MTASEAPSPLADDFADLDDPRRGPLYPIEEILLLTVCGVICGADTFVAVEQFGQARLEWLRRFLPFERGVPSHDTIGRLFGHLAPRQFERCFMAWTHRTAELTEGEVVALDGKTLRGSYDRASEKAALHLVEAWASQQELVLGQKRSEGGQNEIRAIPKLLEMLHLKGCIVTLDAMGCQQDVAEAITEQGADYVLTLKDNQGELRSDVEHLFEKRLCQHAEPDHEETTGGHGRVETRRCWAARVAGEGLVDEEGWPELQSVAMIESERFVAEPQSEEAKAQGETQRQRHYVISSLEADAEQLLRAKRRHWQIENGLHWSLDVAFGEDKSRVRSGHAAENMATLRRLVLSAVRQDETIDAGTKTKRLRAAWDDDYLRDVLQHL